MRSHLKSPGRGPSMLCNVGYILDLLGSTWGGQPTYHPQHMLMSTFSVRQIFAFVVFFHLKYNFDSSVSLLLRGRGGGREI